MKYIIIGIVIGILYSITGCTQLPPKPRPQSYDMVTFCKTYGGVKHCEDLPRDEAKALTIREYQRMLNRMGRF
mgnify:CR=1 FL=1|jgi:hypothetical protein